MQLKAARFIKRFRLSYRVALHYGEHEAETLPPLLKNNDAPPLSGDFKAHIDNAGNSVELGDGAQYSLRLLRPGYVYVFNPADPDQQKWRGYVVTDEQYLQEFQVTEKQLKFKPEGLKEKEAPCKPDKNGMLARCITIPGADLATLIWIAFSDTRWTDKQLRQNEQDAALRDRHMRQINIAEYLKAKKHDHTVCIHSLPKEADGWVRPIVAEYAYATPEKIELVYPDAYWMPREKDADALADHYSKTPLKYAPCDFDFTASAFQRLGSTNSATSGAIESPEQKKALIEDRNKPVPSLSELRPAPAEAKPAEEQGSVLDKIAQKVKEALPELERLRIKSALNGFTRLVQGFDRFYSIQDEQTENSERFKGAGMILALDDAPGIAADLAGLIESRWYAFKTQKPHYRALMNSECIALARTAVVASKAKEALEKINQGYHMAISHNLRSFGSPKLSEELEKEGELLRNDPGQILEREREELLRKYDSLLHTDRIVDFFKAGGEYAIKAKAFGEQAIEPLAKAHSAWFQSSYLSDYFICNFDSSEGIVDKNGKVDARDPGYRAHGGPYVALLEQCIGGTGDHPTCEPVYRQMLSGKEGWKLDEKNLIWMAVNFNRVVLSDKVKEALKTITGIEEEVKSFSDANKAALDGLLTSNAPGISLRDARVKRADKNAPYPPEDEALKEQIATLVSKWGWAYWDAIHSASFTRIDVFGGKEQKEDEIIALKTKIEDAAKNVRNLGDERQKAHGLYLKVRTLRIAEAEAGRKKLAEAQNRVNTTQKSVEPAQTQHADAKGTWKAADDKVQATQGNIDRMTGERETAQNQKAAQDTMLSDARTAEQAALTARDDALKAAKELKDSLQKAQIKNPEAMRLLLDLEKDLMGAKVELARANTLYELQSLRDAQVRRMELQAKNISQAITRQIEGNMTRFAAAAEGLPRINRDAQYGQLLVKVNPSLIKLAEQEARRGLARLSGTDASHIYFAMQLQESAPSVGLKITSKSTKGAQQQAARFFVGSNQGAREFAPLFEHIPEGTQVQVSMHPVGDMQTIIQSLPESLSTADAGMAVLHCRAVAGVCELRAEWMDAASTHSWRYTPRIVRFHRDAIYWEMERERLEAELSDSQREVLKREREAGAIQERADATRAEVEQNRAAIEADLKQHTRAMETAEREGARLQRERAQVAASSAQSAATQERIQQLDAAIEAEQQKRVTETKAVEEAQGKLTRADTDLKNAQTEASKAQTDLETQQKEVPATNDKNIEVERAKFLAYKTARAEELKVLEALKLDEIEYANIKAKLVGSGILAAFNALLAYMVLSSWAQGFDKYKGMTKDKEELQRLRRSDQAYIKAESMYIAAVANFAAGVSDVIQIGVDAGAVTRQWSWAIRISKVMHNQYYVRFMRGASSVLSFVGAVWDFLEGEEYRHLGKTEWAVAYYVSAALGAAAVVVILSATAFTPLGFLILIVYASMTGLVGLFAPDKLEFWLSASYFGRKRKNDSLSFEDWKEEIRSFRSITNMRPALQTAQ